MKHKKALVIAFTLASSLMSGQAMAAYAGAGADAAEAGSGLLSAIVASGGKGGSSGAYAAVEHVKGGMYFFRENIKQTQFVRDFDNVIPMEKYVPKYTTKFREVAAYYGEANFSTAAGSNDQKPGTNVWYEAGKAGETSYLVKIGLEPDNSNAVEIPGVGNLIVPGDSDFGALPEMGAPANDIAANYPDLMGGELPAETPEVSWPDNGGVESEFVSGGLGDDSSGADAGDLSSSGSGDAGGNPPHDDNGHGNDVGGIDPSNPGQGGGGPPDNSNAGGNGGGGPRGPG